MRQIEDRAQTFRRLAQPLLSSHPLKRHRPTVWQALLCRCPSFGSHVPWLNVDCRDITKDDFAYVMTDFFGEGLKMAGKRIGRKITCSIALFFLSTLTYAGSSNFTSSGTFIVPAGVSSVRVLLIGGGGAGAGSHYPGGGSGYLNVDTVSVAPGQSIAITVGTGGPSAGCAGNSCTGGDGGASSFGVVLQAAGGFGGGNSLPGDGDGGSGGGGAGNSGFGGAGGSAGSDGVPGSTYAGGVGQGTGVWTAFLANITTSAATGGAGGIPSTGSHQGGGGAGGILLDGAGPSGGDAESPTPSHTGAFGGIGFGAGGGSGGFNGEYAIGGNGAPGLVYVEWNDPAAVATAVPTLSAYGLALTMLGLLLVAGRRLRG